MDGRNPPLTPSSAAAWKKLNAIHTAQDRDIPGHEEHEGGGGSSSGGGFGEHHAHKKPPPVSVMGGGGLHRELMKNKMDKLTGGLDPREPSTDAPRTPIGPGHKEYADDLPRTPSSQDAWQKLNRIAAAQERQAHHPVGDSGGMESMMESGAVGGGGGGKEEWDPREPDQPRTPVHHGPVGGFPVEDPFTQQNRDTTSAATSLLSSPPTHVQLQERRGVTEGSGGATTRVHIRIEQVNCSKSMHDTVVDLDLLDEARVSIYHATSVQASSSGSTHTWTPPQHFTLSVPTPMLGSATLRFRVSGKKLIGHRDGGELLMPVRSLPITHQPPAGHGHALLKAGGGEQTGSIEMAAYRES